MKSQFALILLTQIKTKVIEARFPDMGDDLDEINTLTTTIGSFRILRRITTCIRNIAEPGLK